MPGEHVLARQLNRATQVKFVNGTGIHLVGNGIGTGIRLFKRLYDACLLAANRHSILIHPHPPGCRGFGREERAAKRPAASFRDHPCYPCNPWLILRVIGAPIPEPIDEWGLVVLDFCLLSRILPQITGNPLGGSEQVLGHIGIGKYLFIVAE